MPLSNAAGQPASAVSDGEGHTVTEQILELVIACEMTELYLACDDKPQWDSPYAPPCSYVLDYLSLVRRRRRDEMASVVAVVARSPGLLPQWWVT